MSSVDLLDRLRSQVVSEMSQEKVASYPSWQDAADDAINAMDNVDLVMRLEIVLNKEGT